MLKNSLLIAIILATSLLFTGCGSEDLNESDISIDDLFDEYEDLDEFDVFDLSEYSNVGSSIKHSYSKSTSREQEAYNDDAYASVVSSSESIQIDSYIDDLSQSDISADSADSISESSELNDENNISIFPVEDDSSQYSSDENTYSTGYIQTEIDSYDTSEVNKTDVSDETEYTATESNSFAAEKSEKKPSAEPNATENAETSVSDNIGGEVWIPKSGKKYHLTSSCSNMKSPQKVTISYAQSLGFTPCKRCYG